MIYLFLFLTSVLSAQTPSLADYSQKINADLPENFDPVTRLRKTTVENNDLIFHFIVLATKEEFSITIPKVKEQVLKTICRQKREGRALKEWNAGVVYRYENDKGQSLGEFLVRPGLCKK